MKIALDMDGGFRPKYLHKIPPEIEAEMTTAVKAFVLAFLEQVDRLTMQVESLTVQVQKLTPRNSSLTPSTEHQHAKPDRNQYRPRRN